jgi:hypothetical protein
VAWGWSEIYWKWRGVSLNARPWIFVLSSSSSSIYIPPLTPLRYSSTSLLLQIEIWHLELRLIYSYSMPSFSILRFTVNKRHVKLVYWHNDLMTWEVTLFWSVLSDVRQNIDKWATNYFHCWLRSSASRIQCNRLEPNNRGRVKLQFKNPRKIGHESEARTCSLTLKTDGSIDRLVDQQRLSRDDDFAGPSRLLACSSLARGSQKTKNIPRTMTYFLVRWRYWSALTSFADLPWIYRDVESKLTIAAMTKPIFKVETSKEWEYLFSWT